MDGMDMGGTGSGPLASGVARPAHGTWEGHVLPGSLFITWGAWMLYGTFRHEALASPLCFPILEAELSEVSKVPPSRRFFSASKQRPFQSPAWSSLPGSPGRLGPPLEPVLKVCLTSFGALCELWLGHVSYRRLYEPDTGRFEVGNLQDWQHSMMYAAFAASGLVDLACHYLPINLPGVEHAFLGLALTVEGLLFAFHLKGSALDRGVHLLLVLTVLLAAACCFAEVRWRSSVLLTTLRCQLVLLQGIWFCQVAGILFTGKRQWDPGYHGSAMMVAPVFALWLVTVALGTFAVFAACRVRQARAVGAAACKPGAGVGVGGDEEEEEEEGAGWAGPLGRAAASEDVELVPRTALGRHGR